MFSSYSPTCALTVAYAVGLAGMLLLIAQLGRKLVRWLGWLSNPDGWFRRTIGVIFVLVGIMVITGFDKQLQTWILDARLYDPIARLEELLGAG